MRISNFEMFLSLYQSCGYKREFPRSRGYPPEKGKSRGTFIKKWFYNVHSSSFECSLYKVEGLTKLSILVRGWFRAKVAERCENRDAVGFCTHLFGNSAVF